MTKISLPEVLPSFQKKKKKKKLHLYIFKMLSFIIKYKWLPVFGNYFYVTHSKLQMANDFKNKYATFVYGI